MYLKRFSLSYINKQQKNVFIKVNKASNDEVLKNSKKLIKINSYKTGIICKFLISLIQINCNKYKKSFVENLPLFSRFYLFSIFVSPLIEESNFS